MIGATFVIGTCTVPPKKGYEALILHCTYFSDACVSDTVVDFLFSQ